MAAPTCSGDHGAEPATKLLAGFLLPPPGRMGRLPSLRYGWHARMRPMGSCKDVPADGGDLKGLMDPRPFAYPRNLLETAAKSAEGLCG